MSDVVPSFFPTPHEIAGGIRWMREHPVVATAAAAAATAVSVITYLKSRAEDEHHLRKSVSHEDSSDADADATPHPPQRERFSTWSDNYDLQPQSSSSASSPLKHVAKKSKSSDDFRMASSSSTQHRKDTADDMYSSTESEMSTSSPTVRRSNPSSLSVSNVAFAFEGCSLRDNDDDNDAVVATAAAAAVSVHPPPTDAVTCSSQFGDLDAEFSVRGETMLEAPTSVGKNNFQFGFPGNHAVIEEEDEENPSMSPQWGWYVSTTPPDEYYA